MIGTKQGISSSWLIVLTAVFLAAFGNIALFQSTLAVYSLSFENGAFLLSLVGLLVCLNIMILAITCQKYVIKPVLITVLMISSVAAYYMDSYHVIIDSSMIANLVETDAQEVLGLLSYRLLVYLVVLGVLPSVLIYKVNITRRSSVRSAWSNLKLFGGALLIGIAPVLAQGDYYASYVREHPRLRYYANPACNLYSVTQYVGGLLSVDSGPLKQIGLEAEIPESDQDRELIILVVGETARADHFSLNGYSRLTNPYLEQESVVSFGNVWSSGTSTAFSVPCMFSASGRSDFSVSEGRSTENVLDVIQRAGVNVIWLDNNSGSKGVADRVPFESYRSPGVNPDCDVECRDVGMLANLQGYIDAHPTGDLLIVLHQMGNHGPEYYKRYPERFERFRPACKTNQLEQCPQEQIVNAYDNSLLYTDYFLYKTIDLLKHNEDFESALVYISDHGESLGEYSLYLHGLPYALAPDAQTHVPMIMWFGSGFYHEIDFAKLDAMSNVELSHDNLFHTLLGLFEVNSSVYDRSMDILALMDEVSLPR